MFPFWWLLFPTASPVGLALNLCFSLYPMLFVCQVNKTHCTFSKQPIFLWYQHLPTCLGLFSDLLSVMVQQNQDQAPWHEILFGEGFRQARQHRGCECSSGCGMSGCQSQHCSLLGEGPWTRQDFYVLHSPHL